MPSLHRVYFLVHDLIVISLTGRLHALYRPSLLTIPNFSELKLLRQRRACRNLQQFSLCLFQIHCPKCLLFQLPSTLRDVNCLTPHKWSDPVIHGNEKLSRTASSSSKGFCLVNALTTTWMCRSFHS